MYELAHLPATELARGFRDGEFTPTDALEDVLTTVTSFEPRINAFRVIDARSARRHARESSSRFAKGSPRSPLDGVPVSVKDVTLTAQWDTRRGSAALPAAGPVGVDSPVVAALVAAGAVVIGKTTTPEIGWKAVTDSPLTGVTRNPWDADLTPGGSSGGAAASVAVGMGAIGIGSDGGGSIRIPAAFTGVVGVKPTRGLVPVWPTSSFGLLSHQGPITRTVDDAILTMSVIGRPDGRDVSFSHADYEAVPAELAALRLDGVRIGYCLDAPGIETDPQVRVAITNALGAMAEGGAELEAVDLDLGTAAETFRTLWYTGAANAVQESRRDKLDPGLAVIARLGAQLTSQDYHRAILQRETLSAHLVQLMKGFDFLATPTVPILPFPVGLDVPPGWHDNRWPTWTPFTWPFNITGQPAVSVPTGLTDAGLPVGIQFIARYGQDVQLLRLAKAYERLRPQLPIPWITE